jgi:acylphosphatase
MKIAHVFIFGFVQGVGFRQWIKKSAEQTRVTGWVRNLPDNRVEAVLQSSASSDQEAEKKIKEMISLCRKGPFLSEVKGVEVRWEETKEELEGFEIVM